MSKFSEKFGREKSSITSPPLYGNLAFAISKIVRPPFGPGAVAVRKTFLSPKALLFGILDIQSKIFLKAVE